MPITQPLAGLWTPTPTKRPSRSIRPMKSSTTVEQNYNVACLYAVASAVAGNLGRDSQELARRSHRKLVAVLDRDPTLADTVESDTDLRLAFTFEELHTLAQTARGATTVKSSA